MSTYISSFTGQEIDDNIKFVGKHPNVIKLLSLISLASVKGGTLIKESSSCLTIGMVDFNNNFIAGVDCAGDYIGMSFENVVSFINNITNNSN